jgi:hypothetical protein
VAVVGFGLDLLGIISFSPAYGVGWLGLRGLFSSACGLGLIFWLVWLDALVVYLAVIFIIFGGCNEIR